MISLDDTIAAISTPVGLAGGIGIIRMSGADALAILESIFIAGKVEGWKDGRLDDRIIASSSLPSSQSSSLPVFRPFRLNYGHIVDPDTGDVVDEVLAAYMPAPKTYTRQDVVEIDAHGGIVAVRRVLQLCLAGGARLAEPGEFTLRAFLNGRLDLAQAEAVLDVVQAKTDRGLQMAVGQLSGQLSRRLEPIRGRLLDMMAYLVASIDFERDLLGEERDIAAGLDGCVGELESVLATAGRGLVYRQGVRTAIVGRPNVGKSSLLNRLLRTSRAIVTDIPGTTRDTLEETLNLDGVPIVLVDTAGMATVAADPIERLGIERSRAALAQADLAILVLDAAEPIGEADRHIAALIGGRPAIVALNKIDLLEMADGRGQMPDGRWPISSRGLDLGEGVAEGWRAVPLSALTGVGIDSLESTIVEMVMAGQATAGDLPLVSNPRHVQALRQAIDQLQAARATCRAGLPADLVSIDLGAAINTLGEITGQAAGEELLDTIFSSFCIGK